MWSAVAAPRRKRRDGPGAATAPTGHPGAVTVIPPRALFSMVKLGSELWIYVTKLRLFPLRICRGLESLTTDTDDRGPANAKGLVTEWWWVAKGGMEDRYRRRGLRGRRRCPVRGDRGSPLHQSVRP